MIAEKAPREGVSGEADRFENKSWREGFFNLRRGEDEAEPGELSSDFVEKPERDRLGSDRVGIGRVEESGVLGELPDIVGNRIGDVIGALIVGRRGGPSNCGFGEWSGESAITSEGLASRSFPSKGI